MKLADIIEALEALAPPHWAEDWDNVGLLVGDAGADVRRILLCVDLRREVLAEAGRARAAMVLAYHPVIFKPLPRVTAADAPLVYEAVRRGIAVYSVHTAFDVVRGGTHDVLAGAMGLTDARPLAPTRTHHECKVVVFVPPDDLSRVADAAFAAGAGRIGNYFDCAFFCHGIGAFCGGAGTHPTVGHTGRHETPEELRLEVIAPRTQAAGVCRAIRSAHSYETPAIDVYPLESCPEGCGLGRIGPLPRAVSVRTLIGRIKAATGLKKLLVARPAAHTAGRKPPPVVTAACGAGACGALHRDAAAAGATFYLTGEMRHHDLLAATAAGLTVACLGHSNSERIALDSLAKRLSPLLDKVAVAVSKHDRDPLEIV